ncbi:MAG: hypothetical protein JXA97_05875 [Anaerolineales bacterium]|nr:hypothetical protein [Anaerolineales bacterium]
MIAVWLGLGLLAGGVNWNSQRRAVVRITTLTAQTAPAWVLAGALLRLTLAALLLGGAVMNGLSCGLAAFAGLWLARWIGILSLKQLPLA